MTGEVELEIDSCGEGSRYSWSQLYITGNGQPIGSVTCAPGIECAALTFPQSHEIQLVAIHVFQWDSAATAGVLSFLELLCTSFSSGNVTFLLRDHWNNTFEAPLHRSSLSGVQVGLFSSNP